MHFRNWIVGVGLTALLLLAVIGCQTAQQDEATAEFDYSRLETPATYHYQMQDTTQVYGKMTQELERISEDGRDLIQVTFDIYGGVEGESVLQFDAVTGDPVSMSSSQRFQGMEMSNNSFYSENRVMRVMRAPVGGPHGDSQSQTDTSFTDIPQNTKDWMQAAFLVQALDLSAIDVGDTLRIPFYQGFGQSFVDTADVTLAGSKTIEVPAGEFDTYQVHIDFAGSRADFFVEKGAGGRVVKQEVPGQRGPLQTVLIPADSAAVREG